MHLVAIAWLVSNRENIDAFRAKNRRSRGYMVQLQERKAAVGDFAAVESDQLLRQYLLHSVKLGPTHLPQALRG